MRPSAAGAARFWSDQTSQTPTQSFWLVASGLYEGRWVGGLLGCLVAWLLGCLVAWLLAWVTGTIPAPALFWKRWKS